MTQQLILHLVVNWLVFTINDLYDSFKLPYHHGSITRGNTYKILNHRFHFDRQKHYFSTCIVNTWNSLPNRVVDVTATSQLVTYVSQLSTQQSYQLPER